MTSNLPIVIIGGGHAAARAAAELRDIGCEEPIFIAGNEEVIPYERPPLSKEVISESVDPATGAVYPVEFYSENHIELLLGKRVSRVDLSRFAVDMDGETVHYSKLMICLGARPRELNISGADRESVLYLRSATDALILREKLSTSSRVIIIGGGFLGLEVAASAVALGCEVTVLEAGPNVLGRGVSPGVASALSEFHRSQGVNIETDISVREITGDKTQTRVICADGAEFSADVVIVGIGILPNTEVLDAAGLECADGICVDEFGEAAPNIYAAGDVARRMSPRAGYAVRMETWENADVQAGLAARNMHGEKTSCDIVPWFWTDQYDQNLQVIGMRGPNDQMVVRGELSERQAMVFHLRNNRVTAAELLNSGRERRQVKRLIELETKIDPRLLSDPDIPISAVIEPAGAS